MPKIKKTKIPPLIVRGHDYQPIKINKKSKILDLRQQIHKLHEIEDEKEIPRSFVQRVPNLRNQIRFEAQYAQSIHDGVMGGHMNMYTSSKMLEAVAKLDLLKQQLESIRKKQADEREKNKEVKQPEISENGTAVYYTEDHGRAKYEFEEVLGKPPFLFILCAPPGGGKTNLLTYLINVLFKDLFQHKNIFVFTGNNGMDDTLSANTKIPGSNYIGSDASGSTVELVSAITEHQSGEYMIEKIVEILTKQATEIMKTGKISTDHICLIFEDMGGAKQFMHNQLLTTIAGLMRHLNVSIIITTWGLSMVPFDIRRMSNGVAIFRLANGGEEKSVFDQLGLEWLSGNDTRVNAARVAFRQMYRHVLNGGKDSENPDTHDPQKIKNNKHNFIWFNRRANHKEEFREGLYKILVINKKGDKKNDDVTISTKFVKDFNQEKINSLVKK